MKKTFSVLLSGIICFSVSVSPMFSANAVETSADSEENPYRHEIELEYYYAENSMGTNNDGISARNNLLNMWGNADYPHNFENIDYYSTVIDHITVNFTVEGIGTDSELVDEDGNVKEPYYAWLCGSIGANSGWNIGDKNIPYVEIKGDGDYSLTWDLESDSETIDCLILQTNINYYNYVPEDVEASNILDSTVRLKVNSVTTLQEGWTRYGDANLDGKVTLADCVAVLQYIANSDKYYLTSAARESADVFNNGDGLSGQDALMIQKCDIGTISPDDLVPPEQSAETTTVAEETILITTSVETTVAEPVLE